MSKHFIVAVVAAATVFSMAPSAAPARSAYDGRWSVVIITDSGECDRAYRYPINIVNGIVQYAGDGSFNISGRVTRNGAVRVTVSSGARRASGSGRLTRISGGGVWRGVAPSGACAGIWQAERRAATQVGE